MSSNHCLAILSSGNRKGQPCGATAKNGSTCLRHVSQQSTISAMSHPMPLPMPSPSVSSKYIASSNMGSIKDRLTKYIPRNHAPEHPSNYRYPTEYWHHDEKGAKKPAFRSSINIRDKYDGDDDEF